MSYCRWSTDFFQCDVYVYEHCNGGWTTHVAGRRMKHVPPESIRLMPLGTGAEWVARHQAYDAWRDTLPKDEYGDVAGSEYLDLAEIGPEAGETYSDPTPGACADRLEAMRAKGFNVPQLAIDELRAEALEGERP